MTLQEFFTYLSKNPNLVLGYFLIIPFIALLMGLLPTYKRMVRPNKQIYTALIFLSAIPGILAIMLNIYKFLFERHNIMSTDLFTQILPILSFIAVVVIIKKQVALVEIPGFGKLSGLIVMIFAAFAIMWALDRTRIVFVAFSYMPFQYVIGVFVGILFVIRFGWKKFTK